MAQRESAATFAARFETREQVLHYRDRYLTGRRRRNNVREHAALRALLEGIPRLGVALDIPSGTGRMYRALADRADKVILADSSVVTIEVAREDLAGAAADFLVTRAEAIELPDRSVDLVFSHRLLSHIHDRSHRIRMLCEFSRVSRRYLVLSFHRPGARRRLRWLLRCALGRAEFSDQLRSRRQLLDEAAVAGYHCVASKRLRCFPQSDFLLFELL